MREKSLRRLWTPLLAARSHRSRPYYRPVTANTPHPSREPDSRRSLLMLAALVCLGEVAALLVLTVVEVANLSSSRLVAGTTTAVFFLLYALGLGAAAVALVAVRGWARAPLMLSQLIQLGLAWSFHGPDTDWVATLLALSAIVVLVVLVLPSTTAALYGRAPS